jgi:hypothetical protein
MKKSELKEIIKKAILQEYNKSTDNDWEEDYERISREVETGIYPEKFDDDYGKYPEYEEADEIDFEDLEAAADYFDRLEEEKKEKVKDTEEIEVEEPVDTEVSGGGDMKELQSNLEAALEIAKQVGDEKLIDQIGNTLTFFVRAYIVGTGEEGDTEKLNESLNYSDLVKGNTYTYTGGAEPLTVTYVGLTKNNPDKKAGSSMGKGFLFQWENGKYFELNNRTIREYIHEKDNIDESFKRMKKLAQIK